MAYFDHKTGSLENASLGLKEEKGDKEKYTKFFNDTLKRFGVKSPAELDAAKKKEFFNYIDKNYIARNPEIAIEYYVNNFPNQMYAVDSILRGEKAIIKEYDLNKLDLLQRLYAGLPATPVIKNVKSAKDKDQEVNAA